MHLDRFVIEAVSPWETASGGQAIRCPAAATCTATLRLDRASGVYDIAVQYFDEDDGASTFTLAVGSRQIDRWVADEELPSRDPNGHTSTRRVIRGIALTMGDTLRLDAMPEGGVIMCHPGVVDAELERVDPLTSLREQEYAYLKGEMFPRTLAEHGVALA